MTRPINDSNAFSPARIVEELDYHFTQTDEFYAKILIVLFDRMWECKNKIDENPEDKTLSTELAELKDYVDKINKHFSSMRDKYYDLRSYFLTLSREK